MKVNVDIQFRIDSTTKMHHLQNMSDIFSVRLWTISFELKCQSLQYVCQTFQNCLEVARRPSYSRQFGQLNCFLWRAKYYRAIAINSAMNPATLCWGANPRNKRVIHMVVDHVRLMRPTSNQLSIAESPTTLGLGNGMHQVLGVSKKALLVGRSKQE